MPKNKDNIVTRSNISSTIFMPKTDQINDFTTHMRVPIFELPFYIVP